MWLENLAAYSLQVAALVLAAGALTRLFRVKAPAALLAFWQILLAICLLLPVVQPWRRQVIQGTPPPIIESGPVAAFPSPGITASASKRPASFPLYPTIAAILLAGVGARFLWLAFGLARLHHCRSKSRRLLVIPDSIRDMQRRVGVSPRSSSPGTSTRRSPSAGSGLL